MSKDRGPIEPSEVDTFGPWSDEIAQDKVGILPLIGRSVISIVTLPRDFWNGFQKKKQS